MKFNHLRPPKHIGDEIRMRRIGMGLKQKELAKFIGVTTDTIVLWERGVFYPMKKYHVLIHDFLGHYCWMEVLDRTN